MVRSVSPLLLVLAVALLSTARAQQPATFTLTSPDVHQGQTIPSANVFNGMGCTGQNVSPALAWSGAPAGTKSFAVTIYDPDAPTGSGWWHWVVYNIPAAVTSLPAGAGDPGKMLLAGATQGNTDFGAAGYGGPCPPPGDKPHHYHITVYALNVEKIEVPANATAAYVGYNLHAHLLARAELTALYSR